MAVVGAVESGAGVVEARVVTGGDTSKLTVHCRCFTTLCAIFLSLAGGLSVFQRSDRNLVLVMTLDVQEKQIQ